MKRYNLRSLKNYQEPYIIKAATNENLDVIDKFVANGGDINAPLSSTGPQSGYTALHFAVLRGTHEDFLEKLVRTYGANVNSVGADGAQPIHISCIRLNYRVFQALLKLGADPNAKLSKEVFEKYQHCYHNWKWPEEFDHVTFCSLLSMEANLDMLELLICLVKYKGNIEVKDKNNKTLLMYGAQMGWSKYLQLFNYKDKCKPEFINARDNNGLHAVHYLLPNEKLGVVVHDRPMWPIDWCLKELINAGADVNAMVNNDPDTLLINMAAYRTAYAILEILLEFRNLFPVEGRPLKYLKLQIDPEELVEDSDDREVKETRNRCLKIILENYTLRREFGLFVPEEEKKLMDQLIVEDDRVKKIVEEFKANFIRKLKVSFREKLTIYDLAIRVFDRRSLKLLVKDVKIVEDYENYFYNNRAKSYDKDKFWFFNSMLCKINGAIKRRNLMKKVEKISELRKVIPLPYEIVLMITEYFSNEDLGNFVNSFYQVSICQ